MSDVHHLTAVSLEVRPERRVRKPRKPSIRRMIAAAEKAGKTVTSITMPDGTVLHFGEAAAHRGEQPVARRSQGDEAMKLPKYVQALGRSRWSRALLFPPPWLSARAPARPALVAVLHGSIRGRALRAAHCHRCGPHQAGQRGRRRRRVFRLATILRLEKSQARNACGAESLSASAPHMAIGRSRYCRRNGSRRCLTPSRRTPPAVGS